MRYAIRVVVALLSLVLTLAPPALRAAEPVDLLLVLAADVSRSVTEPKFKLQREGAAAAITHPDVVKAITSGPNRRIAVCFVEWATAGQQNVVIDWTVIDDGEAARCFGDKLVELPRSFAGSTSISHAIDFSVIQLERSPYKAERRVIDISGDGNNNSGRSVTDARDDALAKGITINALVILTPLSESFRPEHTHPPGGLVCSGRNDSLSGVRITRALIVTSFASASSRASVTRRPELLLPSPEISMTRRSAL